MAVKFLPSACLSVLGAAVMLAGCAVGPDEGALTPDQRTELKTLSTQLEDPSRSPKTKREAATLLLTRPYPQALAALKQFLRDDSNRAAQVAIAEAEEEY